MGAGNRSPSSAMTGSHSLSRRSLVTTVLVLFITCLVLFGAHRKPTTNSSNVVASNQGEQNHDDQQHTAVRPSKPSKPLKQGKPGKLRHLLFPATGFNDNMCKGLSTALMLDYPDPVVVGIKELRPPGEVGSKAHETQREKIIFKLVVVLEYLDSLSEDEQDDLALAVDAFDSWLLLRPEIVESRYRAVIQSADERLRQQGILGKFSRGTPISNSVVFGMDQTCWPHKTTDRPACGHVPLNPLLKTTGTPTDITEEGKSAHGHWLNSGVYIGPVRDLRRVIRAALRVSEFVYAEDFDLRWDDQGALGDVWGEQELARSSVAGHHVKLTPEVERLSEGLRGWGRTEHGIVLDYESQLVQNAHASMEFVEWTEYRASDADVHKSAGPFGKLGMQTGWGEVKGGFNNATEHTFPIFHMTIFKELRKTMWPMLWFHPHGQRLLDQVQGKVVKWSKASNLVERQSWGELCAEHVETLFPKGGF